MEISEAAQPLTSEKGEQRQKAATTTTNKYLFEAEIVNKLSSKANVPNEFKMLVLV